MDGSPALAAARVKDPASTAWTAYSVIRERATFAVINVLICVLVPLWSAFDFYLEPAHAREFLALRLADVVVTIGASVWIARSSHLVGNRIAMTISVLAVGFAIVAMMPQVHEPEHYMMYVLGFSLVFWGAGLVVLWPLRYFFAAFGSILVVHVIVHLELPDRVSPQLFVGSLFYLCSAAMVAGAQLVVRRRLVYQAFCAARSLEQRNTELAETVDVLGTTQARLAATSAVLADSLDSATTADHVLATLVPGVASWATLIAPGPYGTVTTAAAHVVPELRDALGAVLAERASEPIDHEPASRLTECLSNATSRDVARVLGPRAAEIVAARSLIVAPLVARGQRAGTIVLGRTDRGFEPHESAFAEELSRRAALALENARLYREAEDAVRLREDFISIASHELRTPLSALGLIVEGMLASAGAGDRGRDTLVKLDRQVVRLNDMVAQLLDVSQLAAGKFALEAQDIDLTELVREVVDQLADSATRAGSAIELAMPSALAGRWDRARLGQVISNLIANAIKYGRGRPLRVLVEASSDSVSISVSDHGVGIAESDRARIFERFERAARTRRYSGFGLGLWIAHMIVDGLGGTIRVESAVDQGSTFTVDLPWTRATPALASRAPAVAPRVGR